MSSTMAQQKKKSGRPAQTAGNGNQEPDFDQEWVTRSVRFPKELLEWLDGEAPKERRSTGLHIVYLLEQMRKRTEGEEQPA